MIETQKETLIGMYVSMMRIRRFEEELADLFAVGGIPGIIHTYIGEEAIAVGACSNLRKDDYITSTHRGHGHCIAKGGNLKKMAAEILGKDTGYCRGRGGSMHICAPEVGIVGCSGVVGSTIPIAAGVGLSAQMRKTDQVCVCFFGEGGANTGAFHEGLNMAAIWKLPVIFICENNVYSLSTPAKDTTAIENVADRGASYNIPGILVDGMNSIEMYKVSQEAVKRARMGEGPTLIEAKTYRFRGHEEGDPGRGSTYRNDDEVAKWQEKDPLKTLKSELLTNHQVIEKELDDIKEKINVECKEAIKFAQDSPYPSTDTVMDYIFSDNKPMEQ